jgi:uncharacterized protein (DUF2141 family)
MNLGKQLHWLLYILFVLSCARQSTPTGGPKDTIPPVLISSDPRHEQVNYEGNTIELTFSELIALNNPKEQLIVTPTIGKDYEITVRNNRVVVKLDKPVKDSTTYTLNFREAVRDVTEKNPVRNLKLAFSTGTYIDSMSIQGVAFDERQQKILDNVTVVAQPLLDTFNIFKHQATYLSLTNKEGVYNLDNLKNGRYVIYAFTDQNKNLIVDSRNESYGFIADTIQLDSAAVLDIGLVKQDMRELKMTSARPFNTYFNIKSSKNTKDFKITSEDTTVVLSSTYGTDQSNIVLYNTFPGKDSLKINVFLYDSVQNKFDTTVYAKFRSGENITPEKFEYQIFSSNIHADKGTMNVKFKFSKPLKEKNLDSLYFVIDSTQTIKFKDENFNYESKSRVLTLTTTFDKKLFPKKEQNPLEQSPQKKDTTTRTNRNVSLPRATQSAAPTTDSTISETKKQATSVKKEQKKSITNQLFIGKTAFISIEQDTATRQLKPIEPKHTEDLGVILVEIPQGDEKVVVELLTKDNSVVQTVRHKNVISFEDLEPDDYQIRMFIDSNENGEWDAGNYYKKQEPEKVYYYENETGDRIIKLKANFEIGPLLITY